MADRSARPRLLPLHVVSGLLVVVLGLPISADWAAGSDLRETAIVKAVRNARGAVVNLRGEKTVTTASGAGPVDPGRRVNGMGTGVIIDERGYVLTNHHVVDGVREIQVTLADGRRCTAELVARDPETDLAIIKLHVEPRERFEVIKIGTSADLMPGEPVVAVGNAFGYEHTVTRGIVSALHRAVQVSDAQFYEDLIQTDASINPGNSGGPLLNIDGEMIGINVAVRAGAQGIGFAIPVDKAMAVASDLLAHCGAKKVWHGLVPAKHSPGKEGPLVVGTVEEKSPAESAGLKAGDVIVSIGQAKASRPWQTKIDRPLDFHRALLDLEAGSDLDVTVRRGDETLQLTLTLAKAPAQNTPANPVWELLGMDLKPIPPAEFRQQFRTRYEGGLLITAVRPGSPAAEQGIRRGDVLVGMHIWSTVSIENVTWVIKRPDFASLNPVKFFILRGNDTLYGYLPVAMVDRATE
ncbi:MAG: trypsin-like peptidase domain-containing protein [Thermoguttaceae bacterium]|jgi:serine protease Do|nr:trypsin-like peptidase domain-containing protein [Thermoguttaceae bacterium]